MLSILRVPIKWKIYIRIVEMPNILLHSRNLFGSWYFWQMFAYQRQTEKEVLTVSNILRFGSLTLPPNKKLQLHSCYTGFWKCLFQPKKNPSLYPVTLELEAALKPSQICIIRFWCILKPLSGFIWFRLRVQWLWVVSPGQPSDCTHAEATYLGNCRSWFAPFQTEL